MRSSVCICGDPEDSCLQGTNHVERVVKSKCGSPPPRSRKQTAAVSVHIEFCVCDVYLRVSISLRQMERPV